MTGNEKEKKPILEQLGNLGIVGYLALAMILKTVIAVVSIIFGKRRN